MGISLFPKGPKRPAPAPDEKAYGNATSFAAGNRAGGTYVGTTGKGSRDGERAVFDYSQTGKQVGMPDATKDYDFNPMNQAIAGFGAPRTPHQAANFNFAGLPDQYYQQQYDLGAKDIRREGAGNLQQLKQAIGTRRPGLLMKAGQDSERNIGELLAGMRTQLGGEAMREKSELGTKQQLEQAGENLRTSQFNADDVFRNLGALAETGSQKAGLQSDITQRERDYQDRAIEYLMDLYKTQFTSRRGMPASGGSPGVFGTAAGLAGTAAKGFL